MRNRVALALSSVLLITAAGCGGEAGPSDGIGQQSAELRARGTIVDRAIATPSLSTLVAAVQRAGLVSTLSDGGPFTVFAPTNAAFERLLAKLGARSLDDIPVDTLRTVLLSHVAPRQWVPTWVFLPFDFSDRKLDSAGPLKLELEPASRGKRPEVNGIDISTPDVFASNGVVHIIDEVLPVPDARPTITEAAVDLSSKGQFTTLTAAVVKAGLADLLADEDAAFTVFAPTDAAFARIGLTAATIAALDPRKPEDKKTIDGLKQVLLDHVATHELSTPELTFYRAFDSAGGLDLRLNRSLTRVNNLPILALDAVGGRNGVIHVIDGVLLRDKRQGR